MELYDVLIVGGGPIGLASALEAKKNNLKYIIIEKGTVANSLYNYPLYMTFSQQQTDWKLTKSHLSQQNQNLADKML